jgi:subtilisin family serine protease
MGRSRLFRRARPARGLRIAVAVGVLSLLTPAAKAAVPSLSLGRYIVVLDPAVADSTTVATDHARRTGASVSAVFGTLSSYTATFRPQDLQAVRSDPRTRLVVKDEPVKAFEAGEVEQAAAPYGVDRVDQAALPLDGKFAANHDGEGVTVYVIDSGIRAGHQEFGGRASVGPDFVGDGRNGVDCNGHGTHVAGIVGGRTYGVAKKVKIVGVRALNCNASGKLSGVLAAINWVAENHVANSVANLSLGGSGNRALDLAVSAAVGKGVPFTLAAGNGNLLGGTDACNVSPARVRTPGVMTVGASDSKDARASFSNYGACVDWFAPGKSIKSAWRTGDSATSTKSGTSMAAPFAAGVAALYLDANPGTSPAALEAALLRLTQESAVVRDSRTALEHSHVVYTGGAAGL